MGRALIKCPAQRTAATLHANRSKQSVCPVLCTYSICACVQGNHPALRLLRQRAAQNSLPHDRKDKFKLGLVVEGGGMRGAVSAGGLLELGNLGFRQASAFPLRLLPMQQVALHC